jgi:hypothetical protein
MIVKSILNLPQVCQLSENVLLQKISKSFVVIVTQHLFLIPSKVWQAGE